MTPFDSFFSYNYDGYMSSSSTSGSGEGLVFDNKLKTAPDGVTVAIDRISKSLFGEDATARDFVDFLVKHAGYSNNSSSGVSTIKTIATEVRKCVLTERDAEEIADRAANWSVNAIMRNHCLTDIIADSTCVAQYLLDEIVEYILWVLGDEYDFRIGAMDEKPGVEEAVATICDMIDWEYIWKEIDQIAHSLLIRMTIGILRHVETTLKEAL